MKKVMMLLFVGVLSLTASFAENKPLLAPSDAIIAVDADGQVSISSYPGAESPAKVLDATSTTKYLNFGKDTSGFIVTPASGLSVLQSFVLTTANDWAQRDPASFILYGTNDAITSTDNSTGLAENWTLIGSGALTLPDTRFTVGPVVSVANSTAYTSYKMVYPTLKDAAATNSMQVADVAFFQTSDGTGSSFLANSDPILAINEQVKWNSSYPGAENPKNIIDGTNNKYLNFGKTNSGFIVTPGTGGTIVKAFQITTANDALERDPASWILYGTNDPITSGDNTDGLAENWTLIGSGSLALPDARLALGDMISVANDAIFASYKLVFPTLKNAGATNSMQIAEVQFFGVPEPTTLCLLGLGAALLRRRS